MKPGRVNKGPKVTYQTFTLTTQFRGRASPASCLVPSSSRTGKSTDKPKCAQWACYFMINPHFKNALKLISETRCYKMDVGSLNGSYGFTVRD